MLRNSNFWGLGGIFSLRNSRIPFVIASEAKQSHRIDEQDCYKKERMYLKSSNSFVLIPMKQVREYRKNIMEVYSQSFYEKLLEYKLKSESEKQNSPNPNFLIQTAVYFHRNNNEYVKKFFMELENTNLPNKYVEIFGNDGLNELIKSITKHMRIRKSTEVFKDIFDEVHNLLRPSFDLKDQRTLIKKRN